MFWPLQLCSADDILSSDTCEKPQQNRIHHRRLLDLREMRCTIDRIELRARERRPYAVAPGKRHGAIGLPPNQQDGNSALPQRREASRGAREDVTTHRLE